LGTKSTKGQRKLTLKQIVFAQAYISTETRGNGTQAARRAGYKGNDSTLAQVAYKNLRIPEVEAYIDKLQMEVERSYQHDHMSAQEVVGRLTVRYSPLSRQKSD
jgi:phage terminase small subunit